MAKTVQEQPPTDDEVAGYVIHAADCDPARRRQIEITHHDTSTGSIIMARCIDCAASFPPPTGVSGPEVNLDTAAHFRRSVERRRHEDEQRNKGGK